MNTAKETEVDPVWVRPKTALRIVEIGSVTLYGWIKTQRIKSRNVKAPGNVRGIRLIYLPSLLELVEKSPSEAALAPNSRRKGAGQ
jgi:hypothetical protein